MPTADVFRERLSTYFYAKHVRSVSVANTAPSTVAGASGVFPSFLAA
jgi:hypothetical protein